MNKIILPIIVLVSILISCQNDNGVQTKPIHEEQADVLTQNNTKRLAELKAAKGMFHSKLQKHYSSHNVILLQDDHNFGQQVDFDLYWTLQDSAFYLVEYSDHKPTIVIREFTLLKQLSADDDGHLLSLEYECLETMSKLHSIIKIEAIKSGIRRFSYTHGDNIYYYTMSDK